MAMVSVDSGSLLADSQPKSFGLVLGWRLLGAILHSSDESVNSHNGFAMMTALNIVLELLLLLLLLFRATVPLRISGIAMVILS